VTSRVALAAGAALLPYVPYLAGLRPIGGLSGAAFLALAGLGAPLAAGACLPGGTGAARRFVRGLAAAALVNGLAFVALKVAGIPPGSRSVAAALAVPTVALAVLAAARGSLPRAGTVAWIVGAAAFVVAFAAGSRIVPALEDQDMEVQGTAYGIAHDLVPVCATNRSTLYWFAHPLLHHVFVASSLGLADELDTVRPAYDLARRELERLPAEDRARGPAAIVRAFRSPRPLVDASLRWYHEVLKPFEADPALLPTRSPGFLFAALLATLAFRWMRALGAGVPDAALVTAAYVTLPEVVVRSGYGGYYAGTGCLLLAGLRLASAPAGGGRAGLAAGFLGSLFNQKTLVLATAVAAHRGLAALRERAPTRLRGALPYLGGVAAGMAAFWAYGLTVFPPDFVLDHVLAHGLQRFDLVEAVGRSGQPVYPSRAGLWLEFARHSGWIWTALASVAVVRGLRRPGDAPGALAGWVVVGAVAFTVIDWRQTKHLSLLLPAIAVLQGWLLGRTADRTRWALRALLLVSITWNTVWIAHLSRDFTALAPTPLW